MQARILETPGGFALLVGFVGILTFAAAESEASNFPIVPGRIQSGSASAVGPRNFRYPTDTVFETVVSEGPGANEMTIALDGFFIPGGVDVGTEYQFALPIVVPGSLAELLQQLGSPDDPTVQDCIGDAYDDLVPEPEPRAVTRLAPSDESVGQCGIASKLWRDALTDPISLTLDMVTGDMNSEDIPVTAFIDQSGSVRFQSFTMNLTTDTLNTGNNPCNPFGSPLAGHPYEVSSGEVSLVFYSCLDDFDPNITIRADLRYRLTGFPLPEPTAALGGLASLVALAALRRRSRQP